MRKCRNWQTSKTKDLVSIALVWVQVPSSALQKETSDFIRGFLFIVKKPHSLLNEASAFLFSYNPLFK